MPQSREIPWRDAVNNEELPPVPDAIAYPEQELSDEDFSSVFEEAKVSGLLVKRPSPLLLADQICSRFFPVTFKGQLYLFNPNTHLYYEDTGTVKQWVRTILTKAENRDEFTLPPAQKWDSTVRDVHALVSYSRVLEGKVYPFNCYSGYPAENCVISFADDGTVSAEPYTHLMKFTRKTPVVYNPSADTRPVVSVLQSWMPGHDDSGNPLYEWLLQIPAQAIIQSFPGITPFKKAYLMLGKPNAGKSSYYNLLQLFFGEKNCGTFMLHEFSDNFIVAELPGKFLNNGDDLPFIRIEASNKFKALTGKRYMTVNPKFGKPYEAQITAVQTFSANYPPELASTLITDDGWWDRWVVLVFAGVFEKDPTWEKRTFTRVFLEGFFLLVIREVQKIIRNSCRLCMVQDKEQVRDTWVCNLKLLHEFIDRYVEKTDDNEHYIAKEDFLATLQEWGQDYMEVPVGMQRSEMMKQLPLSPRSLTSALSLEGIYPKQIADKTRPYFNITWKKSIINFLWVHKSRSKCGPVKK
ncbi:MAG TPA: DUF5906 domain-containing protein [Methanocorpusculum sp.]|nr:DUF5906 domain-containing protein [Methanocorpusculum sp.]HJJ57857.1 DUF5906 domain-containing protein [Methanocorpusculum sp.]